MTLVVEDIEAERQAAVRRRAVGVAMLIAASLLWSLAGMAILLQYTQPVWCAIFAWYFLRRRIDRRTLLALVVASVGVAVMIIGQPRGSDWVGPMCGLLSGVAFGA